uniref:Uncharacterized protein n=1 Tax=Ananas comosus var. bracteatus TaxID=296719 RepID=A0A6V7PE81_ANACO|nr:unnamed protein product [Ananas comosus var. bracteatus]
MSLLKRKGKLEESASVVRALLVTTSSFLKSYVVRYQDDVPAIVAQLQIVTPDVQKVEISYLIYTPVYRLQFSFLFFKKTQVKRAPFAIAIASSDPFSPHGLAFLFLKSLSLCSSTSVAPHSQTLTFLIDSCGLSPESAISASQKLRFKSTENPSAVLRLLRDYGFGETHIYTIISRHPNLLSCDSHRILRPKIEALRSFGFSGESLARVLTVQPALLTRSLEKHIIPCLTFLRTLLASDGDFVSVFTRYPRGLNADLNKSILPILAVLREHNLPEDRIPKLVKIHPRILILSLRRAIEIVDGLKPPGSCRPISSSSTLSVRSPDRRARAGTGRWRSSRALGCPRPTSFRVPEAPVGHADVRGEDTAGPRVFLRRLKFAPDDILKHPILLCYSLEKRILPRCAVISVLKRKGKLEESLPLIPALTESAPSFLKRFVMRYQDDIPEVLKAYNGEIKFNG